MKKPVDRIENEMETWLAKEQRWGKLFSTAVIASKDFQRDKLAYLEHVREKYKVGLSPDERLTMGILNRERKRIERQIYPSLAIRLVRRALISVDKSIRNIRQQQMLSANELRLQKQISDMGFDQKMGRGLREQMLQGKDTFNRPVSWYNSPNEQTDYDLSFKRQPDGAYKIETLKAALKNKETEQSSQYQFDIGNRSVTVKQAANLLAGRAVHTDGKWLQLDLNDKDVQGKFRVKEFYPGYGYDLLKAVQRLPLKELRNQELKEKLLEGLMNGERMDVTARLNGKNRQLSIEANPQFKTINIFDEGGQKISLATALGKEIRLAESKVKELKQETKVSKGNKVSVG